MGGPAMLAKSFWLIFSTLNFFTASPADRHGKRRGDARSEPQRILARPGDKSRDNRPRAIGKIR
jgi:hypothetical protein